MPLRPRRCTPRWRTLTLHAEHSARRLHRHFGCLPAGSAGDRRPAVRAPRAHARSGRAPGARLAPGLLLRRLRRDRGRAHLARRGQPGAAVGAHDRAPAARRHRRAVDRARPDRAAARARPEDSRVRPAARCCRTRRSPFRCGRSICTAGISRASTRRRCATPASMRSSTRCSSASASTCGCASSARCRRPSWFGNLGKLIYIVAVRLAGTVLGNIFLWSGTVFYPYYIPATRAITSRRSPIRTSPARS